MPSMADKPHSGRGRHYLLEVCVESVADAVIAEQGGADRLELCCARDLGGLTPSVGLYSAVRAATTLPILCLIRPRPGDFISTAAELNVMARDIVVLGELEPTGFVLGALKRDGTIDRSGCEQLIAASGTRPVVFHRAFDCTSVPESALETLVELGFTRVLTSGGAATALAGAPRLRQIQKLAGNRIEVLPGGGIRSDSIVELLRQTGCDQVHGSFSEPLPVSDKSAGLLFPNGSCVRLELVAASRRALDQLASPISFSS